MNTGRSLVDVVQKIDIMILVKFLFDYSKSTFVVFNTLEESSEDGPG